MPGPITEKQAPIDLLFFLDSFHIVKRVYTAESLVDGQLVVDLLEDAGVPALLFHQNAQGALGELPVTYPEVWIKRDPDEPKAIQVVDRFGDRPHVETINCGQCGEKNPGTFEICWQCHSILPVDAD